MFCVVSYKEKLNAHSIIQYSSTRLRMVGTCLVIRLRIAHQACFPHCTNVESHHGAPPLHEKGNPPVHVPWGRIANEKIRLSPIISATDAVIPYTELAGKKYWTTVRAMVVTLNVLKDMAAIKANARPQMNHSSQKAFRSLGMTSPSSPQSHPTKGLFHLAIPLHRLELICLHARNRPQKPPQPGDLYMEMEHWIVGCR